jgi:hypothetical protein
LTRDEGIMRNVKALLIVWSFAAAVASAAEIWDKPFMEWSEKEIEKVLTDSPWAGKATLTHEKEGANLGPIDLTLMVNVRSATPVRMALVRRQLAAGLEASPDLEKNLSMPHNRYAFAIEKIPQIYQQQLTKSAQIAVLRLKGKPVNAVNAAVQLLDKEGKPYTPPARGPRPSASTGAGVEILPVSQRGGGGFGGGGFGGGFGGGVGNNSGITATLVLEFPKSEEVTSSDGAVEISTIIGTYKVRKEFKLKDMTYKGALSF